MENLTLSHTENLTLKNAETAIAAAKTKAAAAKAKIWQGRRQ